MLSKIIKYVFIAIIFISYASCKKSIDSSATPRCIRELIVERIQQDNCLKTVFQYQYKGTTVYLFESDCPDFFHDLYSYKCQKMCSPSGGFTGDGDGKCPEFYTDAIDEVLIWQR